MKKKRSQNETEEEGVTSLRESPLSHHRQGRALARTLHQLREPKNFETCWSPGPLHRKGRSLQSTASSWRRSQALEANTAIGSGYWLLSKSFTGWKIVNWPCWSICHAVERPGRSWISWKSPRCPVKVASTACCGSWKKPTVQGLTNALRRNKKPTCPTGVPQGRQCPTTWLGSNASDRNTFVRILAPLWVTRALPKGCWLVLDSAAESVWTASSVLEGATSPWTWNGSWGSDAPGSMKRKANGRLRRPGTGRHHRGRRVYHAEDQQDHDDDPDDVDDEDFEEEMARGELDGSDRPDKSWENSGYHSNQYQGWQGYYDDDYHYDQWHGGYWEDWSDRQWEDEEEDDEDEEIDTATATELSEAYAAGWRAKAQAAGHKQGRGYRQPRVRGSDRRDTDARKRKSTCSSCLQPGHWRGDPECPKVQSGEVPLHPKHRQAAGRSEVSEALVQSIPPQSLQALHRPSRHQGRHQGPKPGHPTRENKKNLKRRRCMLTTHLHQPDQRCRAPRSPRSTGPWWSIETPVGISLESMSLKIPSSQDMDLKVKMMQMTLTLHWTHADPSLLQLRPRLAQSPPMGSTSWLWRLCSRHWVMMKRRLHERPKINLRSPSSWGAERCCRLSLTWTKLKRRSCIEPWKLNKRSWHFRHLAVIPNQIRRSSNVLTAGVEDIAILRLRQSPRPRILHPAVPAVRLRRQMLKWICRVRWRRSSWKLSDVLSTTTDWTREVIWDHPLPRHIPRQSKNTALMSMAAFAGEPMDPPIGHTARPVVSKECSTTPWTTEPWWPTAAVRMMCSAQWAQVYNLERS